MSSTHPKPWSTKQQELPSSMVARGMEVWHVVDANGGRVFTYDNEWKDAALEIVSAVNSHADLLAACEAALKELVAVTLWDMEGGHDYGDGSPEQAAILAKLESAISKARGHQ